MLQIPIYITPGKIAQLIYNVKTTTVHTKVHYQSIYYMKSAVMQIFIVMLSAIREKQVKRDRQFML